MDPDPKDDTSEARFLVSKKIIPGIYPVQVTNKIGTGTVTFTATF